MTVLYILIGLALFFDFLNGFHDSSNIVATIIFSKAMSPRKALWMTAAAEFTGPFLFGVAVAKTVGGEVIAPEVITLNVVLGALIAAIFWNLFTWYFGIPSSSSHALIGGLLGSAVIGFGTSVVLTPGLVKVAIALFLSPVIGLFLGFLITRLTFYLARNASLRINWFFKKSQILTGLGLALSHGTNDAQKTMGVITLGLLTTGYLTEFEVPLWVVAISAGAIAAGTAFGGWRLIRTLGSRFYKIRPVHGFCTQMTSTSVILGAALLGGPVSTTQVVSSAILGVGSAQRINQVRWGVAKNIAVAWVLTIPITALLSGIAFLLLERFA